MRTGWEQAQEPEPEPEPEPHFNVPAEERGTTFCRSGLEYTAFELKLRGLSVSAVRSRTTHLTRKVGDDNRRSRFVRKRRLELTRRRLPPPDKCLKLPINVNLTPR